MTRLDNLVRLHKAIMVLLLGLALSACDQAEKPTDHWETAVQGLYTAALSSDGRFGIVGSIQHGASLWDMKRKERLFNWNHAKGQFTLLSSAAFSPSGNYAATASDRTIVLWETATGQPVWFWTAPGNILSMALTPDGDYAALGLDSHVAVLFDIKNGGVKRTFNHNEKVRSLAVSADGSRLLTGSDDYTAQLWDIETAQVLQSWQHENSVITTALSDDGRFAFTAAQADQANIWDTGSGKLIHSLPIKKGSYIMGAAYTTARFSENGSRLMTGTNSQLVQLWDIKTGQQLKRWRITKKENWKPTSAAVLAVAFNGTSKYIAIGSSGLGYHLQ